MKGRCAQWARLRPLWLVWRVCGLSPVGADLKCSWLWSGLSAALVAAMSASLLPVGPHLRWRYTQLGMGARTDTLGWYVALFLIAASFYRIKTARSFLRKLQRIDGSLNVLGLSPSGSPRLLKWTVFVRIVLILGLPVVKVATSVEAAAAVAVLRFLFGSWSSSLAITLSESRLSAFVWLLEARFRLLYADPRPPEPPRTVRASRKIAEMEVRTKLHGRLFDLALSLNDAYSKDLLHIVGYILVCGTVNAYYTADQIINAMTTGSEDLVILFFSASIGALRAIELWSLVHACDSLRQEADKFNDYLFDAIMDDEKDVLCNNGKLWAHLSMKRVLNFTACGFFNIDYTLIQSILGTAATYLVILIQFGSPQAA